MVGPFFAFPLVAISKIGLSQGRSWYDLRPYKHVEPLIGLHSRDKSFFRDILQHHCAIKAHLCPSIIGLVKSGGHYLTQAHAPRCSHLVFLHFFIVSSLIIAAPDTETSGRVAQHDFAACAWFIAPNSFESIVSRLPQHLPSSDW